MTVEVGTARIKTNIKNLKLIEDGEAMPDGRGAPLPEAAGHSHKTPREFSPEIDLRGMTGEEAWYLVDRYIDEAIMFGVSTVRLIHGKGTGALKNALWRFLKETSGSPTSARSLGRGRRGVTVLELK